MDMPNGSYTSTIKHFRKKNKVLGFSWFWVGFFRGGGGGFYISRLQYMIFNAPPKHKCLLEQMSRFQFSDDAK